MLISVSINVELSSLNLHVAISRDGRLDKIQPMKAEDVSDWVGVSSRANPIHIYIHDENGLYVGRLIRKDGELTAVGGRHDLRRAGLA
jgi:hypothetical protein